MSSFELWTEKYRPKTLDEIINQEGIVNRMKGFVKRKNTPNLLLAGPAGVGKTTTIVAFVNDLYGPENVRSNFLELNASDERGIDVVRNRIKDFARTSSYGDRPNIFRCWLRGYVESAAHDVRSVQEIGHSGGRALQLRLPAWG